MPASADTFQETEANHGSAYTDRIVAEDFTFVTNNARDFRRLHDRQSIHAGLVILLANVPPPEQRRLFEASFNGHEIEIIRYDLPPASPPAAAIKVDR